MHSSNTNIRSFGFLSAIICLLLAVFWMTPSFARSTDSLKIMVVDSSQGEPYRTVREAMLAELQRRGFTLGSRLQIKHLSLGNFGGPARHIWNEALTQRYDLIFVNGTAAALAFRDLALGAEMPFIFAAVTDPVGIGIIEGFNSPPVSNFTGVSYPVDVETRLRFIRRVMPDAATIGLVYADMPQSKSYRRWLEQALEKPEFDSLKVIYRSVPYIKSEGGHVRMTRLAQRHILELDSQVDVFISPNDQMGVQAPFAQMVYKTATKPLIGLGKKDVDEQWGATMSVYPSLEGMGTCAAAMIAHWHESGSISEIEARWPQIGVAFDTPKLKQFNLRVDLSIDNVVVGIGGQQGGCGAGP
ncbi:MAG: ABC transporter substrate binding protein [Motiliproteus sp.]